MRHVKLMGYKFQALDDNVTLIEIVKTRHNFIMQKVIMTLIPAVCYYTF